MSVGPIRIAVVGMGKIARDQHLPAIASNNGFALAATVSRNEPETENIPRFKTLDSLFAGGTVVDAVALCTPPQVRYGLAAQALEQGKHVFLEKPPGATLSEVTALQAQARRVGATLFASWHSRYAGGVEPARDWLANKSIRSVAIVWREDVRVWHPGQEWIWEAGGLGVFDPGINALSIATRILPQPFFLQSASLSYPANRAAPIAGDLVFRDAAGVPITMDLDWRQFGQQTWDIVVETNGGTCTLSQGGAILKLPNGTQSSDDREYPGLYARFATLVREKRSDVDLGPLRLVADAFLRGTRRMVDPFD